MTNSKRIWYADRVPTNKMLYVNVKSIKEAIFVIKILIKRDLNDDRITDNAMGLEIYENDEWSEYYNDEGESIDDLLD